MSTFFIAEAGVNHNGSLEIALELVDVAARAGADAVKFQTFKAENTVRADTKTVDYQSQNSGQQDQQELLRRLELSEDHHFKIAAHCEKNGIEFMSTAFDEECADFLGKVGISRLKIPSGEITNLPFIRYLAGTNLPIILSTGMATLEEIQAAVDMIISTRAAHEFPGTLRDVVSILHCTSAYPTPFDQLNLRAIQTLDAAFDCPVGYSDHSEGIEAGFMAIALGATVYEKHFTLDRSMPGPDHKASLEPDELANMIAGIRRAEKMMGTGEKVPQPCELQARDLVRRSIFAARDLSPGHILAADDIVMLRPASALAPKYADLLIGKPVKRAISNGEGFTSEDL